MADLVTRGEMNSFPISNGETKVLFLEMEPDIPYNLVLIPSVMMSVGMGPSDGEIMDTIELGEAFPIEGFRFPFPELYLSVTNNSGSDGVFEVMYMSLDETPGDPDTDPEPEPDFGLDFDNAPTIELGVPFESELNGSKAELVFRYDTTPGNWYTIQVFSDIDTFGTIYNSERQEIGSSDDDGDGSNPLITFKALDYVTYMAVRGYNFDNDQGPFRVLIEDYVPPYVEPGSAIENPIEIGSESTTSMPSIDGTAGIWLSYPTEPGKYYHVKYTSSFNADRYLEVYSDSEGNMGATGDEKIIKASDNRLIFHAYVYSDDPQETTLVITEYPMNLEQTTGNSIENSVLLPSDGFPVMGNVNDFIREFHYKIYPEPGQAYEVNARKVTNSYDELIMYLIDKDGNILRNNIYSGIDQNPMMVFATQDEVIYVSVTTNSYYGIVDIKVDLVLTDEAPPPEKQKGNTKETPHIIKSGESIKGYLSVDYQRAYYKLEGLIVGDEYTIETTSSLDLLGYLYNSNYYQVGYDDDLGEGNNPLIEFVATSEVQYFEAKGYSYNATGEIYAVLKAKKDVPPLPDGNTLDTPHLIIPGESIDGYVDTRFPLAYYKIEGLIIGNTYSIETTSNMDMVGYLYDHNYGRIDQGDDEGEGSNPLIEFTATHDVYYFEGKGYGTGVNIGPFTAHLKLVKEAEVPVIPDKEIMVGEAKAFTTYENAKTAKVYLRGLEVGKKYRVKSSTDNTRVELYDFEGDFLGEDTNSGLYERFILQEIVRNEGEGDPYVILAFDNAEAYGEIVFRLESYERDDVLRGLIFEKESEVLTIDYHTSISIVTEPERADISYHDLVYSLKEGKNFTIEVQSNYVVKIISNSIPSTDTLTVSTKDGKFSDSVEISSYDPKIYVKAIKIISAPERLEKGKTGKIEVEFTPKYPTNDKYTLESSDPSIVQVIDNNTVKAVGDSGKASITATSEDGGFKDVRVIEIIVVVQDFKIPDKIYQYIGMPRSIGIELVPANTNKFNVSIKDWLTEKGAAGELKKDGTFEAYMPGYIYASISVDELPNIPPKRILIETFYPQFPGMIREEILSASGDIVGEDGVIQSKEGVKIESKGVAKYQSQVIYPDGKESNLYSNWGVSINGVDVAAGNDYADNGDEVIPVKNRGIKIKGWTPVVPRRFWEDPDNPDDEDISKDPNRGPSSGPWRPISSIQDLYKLGVDNVNYPLNGRYFLTKDIDFSEVKEMPRLASEHGEPFRGTFDGRHFAFTGKLPWKAENINPLFGAAHESVFKNLKIEIEDINQYNVFFGTHFKDCVFDNITMNSGTTFFAEEMENCRVSNYVTYYTPICWRAVNCKFTKCASISGGSEIVIISRNSEFSQCGAPRNAYRLLGTDGGGVSYRNEEGGSVFSVGCLVCRAIDSKFTDCFNVGSPSGPAVDYEYIDGSGHSVAFIVGEGKNNKYTRCFTSAMSISSSDAFNLPYATIEYQNADRIGTSGSTYSNCVVDVRGGMMVESTDIIVGGAEESNGIRVGRYHLSLRKQAMFPGWDFENIWTIKENRSFPYFKWMAKFAVKVYVYRKELDEVLLKPIDVRGAPQSEWPTFAYNFPGNGPLQFVYTMTRLGPGYEDIGKWRDWTENIGTGGSTGINNIRLCNLAGIVINNLNTIAPLGPINRYMDYTSRGYQLRFRHNYSNDFNPDDPQVLFGIGWIEYDGYVTLDGGDETYAEPPAKLTPPASIAPPAEPPEVPEKPVPVEKPVTNPSKKHLSDSDYDLLCRITSAESKGEPYKGQIAVANVILNRVKSSQYPDNLRDVVYQKNQFSPVTDGSINRAATDQVKRAVNAALEGENPIGSALFFWATYVPKSNWVWTRTKVAVIGNHVFGK